MNVLLLDAGLSNTNGHNAALAYELQAALAGRARLTIAAAGSVRPQQFGLLAPALVPAFSIDGYARLDAACVSDDAAWCRISTTIDAELRALAPSRYDALLMPTAYPLYLAALARNLELLGPAPLTVGLLIPPSFWADDDVAEDALQRLTLEALQVLGARADTLIYSETGTYAIGSSVLSLPLLLPPMSEPLLALAERLQRAAPVLQAPLRFGFFGQPFLSKGFEKLIEVAEAGLAPEARLVVRLPAGFDELCARLNRAGERVEASTGRTSNAQYLRAMAEVDVVLAAYDPAHYRHKMSGIVPEAICLGKPLIVSAGCDAIVGFLDRHAPGSFVAIDYSAADLAAALALGPEVWQRLARRARASAAAMRSLKDARRYLALAGIDCDGAPAANAHRRAVTV